MRWAGWLVAAALIILPVIGHAKELGRPAGPVVLTVVGAIGETNRGAYDDFEDAFFKFHERRFDKAAVFDIAMLEALGMHEVKLSYAKWPRSFRFEGPWLKDVLAAAGATGKDISVLALDGYASQISVDDLAAEDWIVAVKRDGRYLDIGQHGPLWVVYARRDGTAPGEKDEQRWPWGVFLIDVR